MKKQLTKTEKENSTQEKNLSLLIISSKGAKMSTIKSLISEAHKRFSQVLVVPINKIQIQTSEQGVALFYKGKNLLCYDVIYPRVSSKDFFLAEAVIKAVESSDAYSPVSLRSFQVTNHKFFTSQVLSNKGLPGVTSTFFISSKRAQMAVSETGYPFVMKLISGFAGKGVVLINNHDQMESILDAVHLFEEFICTQRFIKGKNFDLRCYVIGNLVLTVKRISKKGDWRANISRGGSAQLINPTPEMISIAQNAAKELGMDICAVDLMQHKNKWVVIEVNFMPGPFMKYLGNTIIHEWLRYLSVKGKKNKKLKSAC